MHRTREVKPDEDPHRFARRRRRSSPAPPSPPTPRPQPVTLAAKNGNVTFNHKTHAAQKCEACHAYRCRAGRSRLGKDKAHALCIECHKKEAKGPQKCAECHKKA